MAAEVPVSDVLCEAMEYLSKLGSNLRIRSENLKEKRISKEKLKNSHAVQKAASKVLLICELSKKSLDNVETGVRKVLSMLEASQAPISGQNSHKKNQGSNRRYHYFEYQSRKLYIAKKIPLKHYMSVKVFAKEMPASIQDKYPVYYDCKLKRLRCKVSTKYKTIPEMNTLSDKDQCSEKSICSDVRELSDDDDYNHIEKNSKALEDHCQEKVSNHERSTSKPIVESQDSQCDREDRDHSINQIEEKARNEKEESNSSSRNQKKKIHSKSDQEPNTNNKSNKIRFADVYSSDSNEKPKKSEFKADMKKDTIFVPDVQNNNDHDDKCVSDSSNKEPKAKKLKLTTSDNFTSQLDSDCGEKKSETDKKISNQDLSNKDSDNDSTLSKHCERSQPSSDGDSKPLIRCVNLSKLLKPGILGDNSKLNNVEQSEVKKLSTSKNDRHFIKKDRHRKKHGLSEKENENKFCSQKRKEVREFKAKNFTVNIIRLPNLSLNFLLDNNLKKITRQGNIICEVQNEIDTPNSKQMKAVKNALLNDSESDECSEMPDAMQVKRSLLKDSDSEHNASDEEHSMEPDKRDETNAQEVTKDVESAKDGLSDNLKNNLVEADKEINCNSESTVTDNMHPEVCSPDEEQTDNCDQTPGENTVKDVEAEGKCVGSNTQPSENESEPPNMLNQIVKSSLLNDSSDEEFAGFSNNELCNISKPNKSSDNRLVDQNNSGTEECNIQSNEKTPSTSAGIDETVKSALLNSSSDDSAGLGNQDIETPTKTNEKTKSALLNDSSDENQHKAEEEESPTKVNQKVKSSLLNDSSDIKSDESHDQRERQKTPKSKRKYARRCREVKKKIKYSSSSDSDQDKPRHECHRKKSYISSSSSNEDIKKKVNKKKPLKMDSDSNDKNKSIDKVDGAVDEKSNSSVDKVRK
ncbi:unnamed protein product [Arctia plantaginis]|uniref:Uncharacterized protein n=1 Tax=Arctia plantaginis TaxID=874455 RepID=A0A8S1ANE1_ARCPL|nr:unnamed protein product [Arctia plantaginis]